MAYPFEKIKEYETARSGYKVALTQAQQDVKETKRNLDRLKAGAIRNPLLLEKIGPAEQAYEQATLEPDKISISWAIHQKNLLARVHANRATTLGDLQADIAMLDESALVCFSEAFDLIARRMNLQADLRSYAQLAQLAAEKYGLAQVVVPEPNALPIGRKNVRASEPGEITELSFNEFAKRYAYLARGNPAVTLDRLRRGS